MAAATDELNGNLRPDLGAISRVTRWIPENDVQLGCAAGCPGWGSNLLMKDQVRLIAKATSGESHSQT